MTIAYNLNIPGASDDPSVSQGQMQTNCNSVNTIIGVDHFTFNNVNAGNHNVINMPVPQGSPPGTSSLEWSYYTKQLISGAVETFWQRPNQSTADIQMTTNIIPTAGQNGYTFLPGGLIIAFGSYTLDNNGQTLRDGSPIIFLAPGFPNTCFSVTIQGASASASNESFYVLQGSLTKTGFTLRTGASSGFFTTLYYIAIGN